MGHHLSPRLDLPARTFPEPRVLASRCYVLSNSLSRHPLWNKTRTGHANSPSSFTFAFALAQLNSHLCGNVPFCRSSMTLPWLDSPVRWHGSRVPSEYNFTAMTPEEIKLIGSRWHDVCLPSASSSTSPNLHSAMKWYTADWDYGRTTVYFFCAAIFVFGLANIVFHLRQGSK